MFSLFLFASRRICMCINQMVSEIIKAHFVKIVFNFPSF